MSDTVIWKLAFFWPYCVKFQKNKFYSIFEPCFNVISIKLGTFLFDAFLLSPKCDIACTSGHIEHFCVWPRGKFLNKCMLPASVNTFNRFWTNLILKFKNVPRDLNKSYNPLQNFEITSIYCVFCLFSAGFEIRRGRSLCASVVIFVSARHRWQKCER